MAMARTRPFLIWPSTAGTPLIRISTWPPMRSVNAGALPLYGTCVMLTLATSFSSSPAM